MPHLRYTQDGTPIEVTIDSDDVTIGRSDDCTLQIHGDGEISRLHCAIQRGHGAAYVILDSSSRNGTFVNGTRLMDEARELSHGDRIRIGNTRVVYYESKEKTVPGNEDVFTEIAREMEEGKGFHTMMHEILDPPSHQRKTEQDS